MIIFNYKDTGQKEMILADQKEKKTLKKMIEEQENQKEELKKFR